MDPVEYHLVLAIYRWVGLKPPSYGPSSPLADLWARVYSAPYLWKGVSALVTALYQDPFFQKCPRAHQLTPPMFAPGGGIQTVANLYAFLKPCGQSEEAIHATDLFSNTDTTDTGE